jgi:DNA repair protein RecN (Recombination protein N)
MLASVTIRNIVLIDSLTLEFRPGLCALTGETGAGKSILLDALGLATGARADKGLIRHGTEEASATAEFVLSTGHPAFLLLAEAGIAQDEPAVILRRHVSRDGRGRAFVNDQPVSVSFLQTLGEVLLEVHGQHDDRGLINPAGHRALLDDFGGLAGDVRKTALAHADWRDLIEGLEARKAEIREARAEADYLSHALEELTALAPEEGEEAALASERALMMNAEKIAGDLQNAAEALTGDGGMESRLSAALRRLERVAGQAEGRLDATVAALERALVEAGEARYAVDAALGGLEFEPRRLEEVEERLFALRALARKHSVPADELPRLRDEIAAKLDALHSGEEGIAALESKVRDARTAYETAARALSEKRAAAAKRLDREVARELKPLKLERAAFRTAIDRLPEDRQGPEGMDRVRFEVATNPGAPFGDLKQIASGGELARFILALKVALAGQGSAATLIFDEVDRGVGGAVADAVGERLSRLAASGAQVLVVTHSPQVAARAGHHWRIAKNEKKGRMTTTVTALDEAARQEEVARMLAAAEVTDEARAAAARLLQTAAGAPGSAEKKRA